ncbi:Uncharacterized protein APZ42_032579 [Daphnia magna]|uniref:Uncharacterized protein n=1 Tax=Daphnia magna TaxID=35525 RepID=A0A0P5WX16_9CRUS|nr:Uncharacterized protein APZ42_032579 [Daphnia magna]
MIAIDVCGYKVYSSNCSYTFSFTGQLQELLIHHCNQVEIAKCFADVSKVMWYGQHHAFPPMTSRHTVYLHRKG